MEFVNCNLCGSKDYKIVYKKPDNLYYPDEWFDVVECTNCGLGFVNPRPDINEIGKYYPKDFYDYFEREANLHMERYKKEAKYLESIKSKEKRLLDVGCANGDFPRYMKSLGWEVEGVEISTEAKEITDFKVYRQNFAEIPINEPYYDAITAWAVLEHVHDPMSYFIKASEVLKPGGLFVFLVTNFDSSSSRYLFNEDIPRHLYFFTEKTVKEYLKRNDFRLEKVIYNNKIYSMRPRFCLYAFWYRKIKRKEFTFNDIPISRQDFFKINNYEKSLINTMKYIIKYPLNVFDYIAMIICEKWQILTKNYGIVIYVARKC